MIYGNRGDWVDMIFIIFLSGRSGKAGSEGQDGINNLYVWIKKLSPLIKQGVIGICLSILCMN
ncbi:hypothetical protein A8A57_13620 [Lelliottia amnigena]|nr:hypothetical protein A8A57_13620 [Lelliottia amnigena]